MTDREYGLKVLNSYWNYARSSYSTFNLTFDQFLARIQPNLKKRDLEIENLGWAIRSNDISDSRISSAMKNMVGKSGGKVPSGIQPFFQFISNESTKINWIDAAVTVTGDSLADIAGGAQELGDSLISTAKILNFILPVVLVGGVLLLAYSWLNRASGGDAGRFLKSARKGFK
jgi:hypothetical protein